MFFHMLWLYLFFTVRTWNWTTVSFIRRLEGFVCRWIWTSIARLRFRVTWWQAIPQLQFWMSSCGDGGRQVDHQSGFSNLRLHLHCYCLIFCIYCFKAYVQNLDDKFTKSYISGCATRGIKRPFCCGSLLSGAAFGGNPTYQFTHKTHWCRNSQQCVNSFSSRHTYVFDSITLTIL